MTQVIPAANHPLRIQSEMPRFKKATERQNKPEQQAEIHLKMQVFLRAGGSVQVLTGFPEVIKSQVAMPWVIGH